MDTLHQMLTHALPWLHRYGYAAIVAAIVAEGMGLPTPGQTLLVGGALLARHHEMNLSLVLLCAMAATITGNNLGYAIGRVGGRRLILKLGVNRRRLARLARFYRRYGIWPVLFARFVDGARQLGSMLAGTGSMPWPRFFVFDSCGAALWVGTWGGGTYWMAGHMGHLQRLWQRFDPVAIASVVALLVLLGLWLWWPRRGPSDAGECKSSDAAGDRRDISRPSRAKARQGRG